MRNISKTAWLSTIVLSILASTSVALSQSPNETLIVAGPRTPESLDPGYPPTEAVHEARRNVYERLLVYAMKTEESGAKVEDFSKIEGALAESYEVSPDKKSIVFHLRRGVKSPAGNEMTADDVIWSFQFGWNTKATFHWYMTQILKIESLDAFQKVDQYTVKVTLPHSSPLIDKIWTNSDLGIIDSTEAKKHVTDSDPYAARYLATHSASFAPYYVEKYSPGQEIVYVANPNYYRGVANIKKVIFREMPTSSNRLAALQAGSVDVAEALTPREISLAGKIPSVKVWKVFGNYSHWIEINTSISPLDKVEVRQALNYLVPRKEIASSVYIGTARPTKSTIAEIYPGYTDRAFKYDDDVEKAKELLAKAGHPSGFKTQIAYRNDEPLEEQMAVVLKTAFARAGVDAELVKLPASSLVERYTKGTVPMFFRRDMAIVPDAAYAANLFLNSKSWVNYTRLKNEEVDKLIDKSLTSIDEESRDADMKRVQDLAVEEAPWIFLFNPGYQLATSKAVSGFSWYTPNGNNWYDFSKQ